MTTPQADRWLHGDPVECPSLAAQPIHRGLDALYCPGHPMSIVRELVEALTGAEEELDHINGRQGTEEHLCLFCNSRKWDGMGIIHEHWCVILQARTALAHAQELIGKRGE